MPSRAGKGESSPNSAARGKREIESRWDSGRASRADVRADPRRRDRGFEVECASWGLVEIAIAIGAGGICLLWLVGAFFGLLTLVRVRQLLEVYR
ncbi:MAG: hypothetical protein HC882_05050, partial [Acidobacteria bacterium]|nr:hypothetical protein [Acidobacteriota bacterium]